jgi:hypothetical protein
MRAICSVLAVIFLLIAATSAQPAFRVRFDQTEYAAVPGEPVTVRLLLDPVPSSGLFSFGIKLTFEADRAKVVDTSAITVVPPLDFNGFFGAGAFKEVGPGFAGVKGTVNVIAQPLVTYSGPLLATFSMTLTGTSPAHLGLELFRTVSPNEDLFIDGNQVTLDSGLTFGSATLNPVAGSGLRVEIKQAVSSGQTQHITLSFPTCASMNYTVEAREVLPAGTQWQPLPGAPHNSGSVEDVTGSRQRFYRVRSEPARVFVVSIQAVSDPNSSSQRVILAYPACPGWDHTVEYRDSVGPGTAWQSLPGGPHNNGTVIDNTAGVQRFYRVRLSPPSIGRQTPLLVNKAREAGR